MGPRGFANVPLMRKPDKNAGTVLDKFQKTIEDKYKIKIGDRHDLHKWSVENIAEFWSEFWDFMGVVCSKKFDQVIDLAVPMEESPEWFPGARLNLAENLLKYKDDKIALIAASEDKAPEYFTFAQMSEIVSEYAAAFKNLGLKKGDVVACYTSNRAEPVFAMNATLSIGAVWAGALPLFGVQAVLYRFKLVKPKILLTVDRFKNDNQEIDMLGKVKEIVDALPSIEKVIIVPSTPKSKTKDISGIRGSCFLDEFLESGRNADGTIPPLTFEQVSFSHPVYISFTSGTTGIPKPIIHGFGAIFPAVKDHWLQQNCSRDSLWFCASPVGWVSWNMSVALNFCGSGLILFEGVPYFLTPTYFWDLIDQFGCTHIFMATSAVDALEKRDCLPSEKNSLKTLKGCIAGGSVVKPQSYDFMYRKIKSDIMFFPSYGSTEVLGAVLNADPTLPVYKGEIPIASLGVDFQCVDETGKPVEGEIGEVIISKPYPSLPVGIWGDPDRIKFKNYFQTFPGKFAMKDFGRINPITKGFVVCGRREATLKQREIKFASSEIYNIVEVFPEVQDSVCTSQYNKDNEERAVLFLKMREGHLLDDDLLQMIRNKISNELSPDHVPEVITKAEDIPYTVNGKKLESVVKDAINNRPYHIESVINPECISSYVYNTDIRGF